MNLDLSQYPKITIPDDKEEIEKRSKTLTSIKDQMENLTNTMRTYLMELASFDEKSKLINQKEYDLKEAEYELLEKEKTVYALEEDVKKEKEYIINANRDIKAREAKILKDKDYLTDIELAKKEWEEKKAEVLKQEAVLDEKLKLRETLENQRQADKDELEKERVKFYNEQTQKEKEFSQRELLIEKNYAIDMERKRLLDVREERIKMQERQLKLDRGE